MAKLKLMSMTSTNTMVKMRVLKESQQKFYEGDVVCIIGPSGSGKSTFFGVISSRRSYKRLKYRKWIWSNRSKNQCWFGPWKYPDGFPTLQPFLTWRREAYYICASRAQTDRESSVGMELLEKLDSQISRANPNSLSGGQSNVWLSARGTMNQILCSRRTYFCPWPQEMVGMYWTLWKS